MMFVSVVVMGRHVPAQHRVERTLPYLCYLWCVGMSDCQSSGRMGEGVEEGFGLDEKGIKSTKGQMVLR